MKPIALGFIGCGDHATHHRDNAGKFLSLTAWDPDHKTKVMFSTARHADTLEALLDDPEVDAVVVCSPDEYHLTQIEMALAAGKHVFCEKPLIVPGEDIARLEAAFDLAREKKLALTSCHPRRFDTPFWWLRYEMGHKPYEFPIEFGKALSFSFDFSYHKPSHAWKHTRSLLLDHLNHEVDLMNFLFGIQGFEAWKLRDDFDHYDVVGKRDDGITFHFQGTRRLDAETYPEWCRVRYERGEVMLDMLMGVAYIIDHEKGTTLTVPKLEIDYDGRLQKVMGNFYDQIQQPDASYIPRAGLLMNTECGLLLQKEGVQRVDVRR